MLIHGAFYNVIGHKVIKAGILKGWQTGHMSFCGKFLGRYNDSLVFKPAKNGRGVAGRDHYSHSLPDLVVVDPVNDCWNISLDEYDGKNVWANPYGYPPYSEWKDR